MDWVALASAADGIIGGLINLYSQSKLTDAQSRAAAEENALGYSNFRLNKEYAAKNFQLQQQAFNYQQQLNQLQMDREDNAFQRRVADLKRAGLSPLMATEGAQAGNLLSGNAPQMDLSGVNSSTQGLMNAKKDYAQRNLMQAQFKLQSYLQIAQLSADLVGAMQEYQKNKLDLEYQQGLNNYVKEHGYRNLNWQSELITLLENLLGKFNFSNVGDSLADGLNLGKDRVNKMIADLGSAIKQPNLNQNSNQVKPPEEMSKIEKFMQFGIIDPKSKFGHMSDNYNYDNDRPTLQLLKEEAKEKIYKNELRNENSDETAAKLWDTDDYLKKHISKEDWLKTSWEFRKNYLKYGYFK